MIFIREDYLANALLIVLLALSQLAFAQGSQEPKGRDLLIKESIANLDADNIHVAAQAARNLGYLHATEGVPAMLRVRHRTNCRSPRGRGSKQPELLLIRASTQTLGLSIP
jgi:hypothetical protein